MSLWRRLIGIQGAAPPAAPRADQASSVQSETQWQGLVAAGGVSRSGVHVDERTTLSLPAVMQALRVLCGVFASIPLHYYRETENGREKAKDDPLWDLFNRDPGHMTPYEFKETLLSDLLLQGNCFVWASLDVRGRPSALTRLKPGATRVAEYFDPAEGYTLFYDVTLPKAAGAGRYSSREVWHVRGMTRDGLVGLNPLHYMRDAIGGAIATTAYTSRYWAGNAKPDTVLTAASSISPEAKQAIKNDWMARFGGVDGERVAVLDQGLKPEFLSHDHEKAQLIETRNFQIADVARAWGVPPHLLFDLSKATFSNIEQQSLEFILYHLGPHLRRVAESATRQFAAPGHYFEFQPAALLQGDQKSRYETYGLAIDKGILNPNEVRERENLNRREGGDRYRVGSGSQIEGAPGAAPAPQETDDA